METIDSTETDSRKRAARSSATSADVDIDVDAELKKFESRADERARPRGRQASTGVDDMPDRTFTDGRARAHHAARLRA